MPQFISPPEHAFVLAHLSDPHLTGLDDVNWSQLLNKRLSGYLSWQRRRRHIHQPERLAMLVRDLHRQAPDHIAVTGDLTQLGTPGECREALQWLQALGSPDRVTVVPGNHDAYARSSWRDTLGLWSDYMSGGIMSGNTSKGKTIKDEAGESSRVGGKAQPANTQTDDMRNRSGFPAVRQSGPLNLIGVNSALPTGPGFATGRLGHEQLTRLENLLRDGADGGGFRALLIHHPPQAGAVSWRKRLTDAPRLRQLLARYGVDLVLHGHAHRQREDWLAVPGGQVPVLGVASASAAYPDAMAMAAYNLLVIERQAVGWSVTLRRRCIHADGSATMSAPIVLAPRRGRLSPAYD